MAKNVIINGVTYQNVPKVNIPLASDTSQSAEFIDISDSTVSANDMLNGVKAYDSSGTPVTGNIVTKTSSDLSASGDTVTVPAGYYASNASKAVASGSAKCPDFITVSNVNVSVSATSSTLCLSATVPCSPNVDAGYISSGTQSNVGISVEKTNVSTYNTRTITPSTSDQYIVADSWIRGTQTIAGDANLISSNIASGVSIFGVSGSLTSATISQDSTTKVLSIS